MFELPEAKRVRRSELYSRSSSAEPFILDAITNVQREQLENAYHSQQRDWSRNDGVSEAVQAAGGNTSIQDDDCEAFEFPLFSKKSASAPEKASFQRIVLRSPTPTNQNPGFLKSQRPDAYYFTDVISPVKAEQYQSVAITGEEIIVGLKSRWPGFELPWRVTTVKLTKSKNPAGSLHTRQKPEGIKRRNGKKRRIAIRKKAFAKTERELNARRDLAAKEAAEKEKRTRKNREKKVKRRQRDKLMKSSAAAEAG